MDNRKGCICIGAMRGGKSFLNKQLAKQIIKGGNSFLVYGYGKTDDFPKPEYVEIEIPTFAEHVQMIMKRYGNKGKGKEKIALYKANKTVEYFKVNGSLYHFSRWNEIMVLGNKKGRLRRIMNRALENQFFVAIQEYMSKTFVTFDDCKRTLMYFNGYHVGLFSAINHTGNKSTVVQHRGKGVDVSTIWHNPSKVYAELWDYCTDVFLFKTTVSESISKDKVEDEWLRIAVENCLKELKNMPKYSCFHIKVETREIFDGTIRM